MWQVLGKSVRGAREILEHEPSQEPEGRHRERARTLETARPSGPPPALGRRAEGGRRRETEGHAERRRTNPRNNARATLGTTRGRPSKQPEGRPSEQREDRRRMGVAGAGTLAVLPLQQVTRSRRFAARAFSCAIPGPSAAHLVRNDREVHDAPTAYAEPSHAQPQRPKARTTLSERSCRAFFSPFMINIWPVLSHEIVNEL